MMRLTSTLQRFYRERRGSVSMMVGLIVPALTTAVMASVEFNSVVVTKAKIQNQADSAALFAANNQDLLNPESGSDLQTATREHIVEAIAVSNLDVSNVQTKYTFDAARDRIVGEVTFTPNAKFLGSVFLPETVKIVTEAAPLRPKKVEISLVLDLSGSMNYSPTSDAEVNAPRGSRRIDALRDGVNSLIDELSDQETVKAKFSIIPYATSVDLTDIAARTRNRRSSFYENAAGGNLPRLCTRQDFGRFVPSQCRGTGDNRTRDLLGTSQTGLWAAERYVSRVGDSFMLSLAKPNVSKVPVVTQGRRVTACSRQHFFIFGRGCVEYAQNIHNQYVPEKNYFATRSGVLPLTKDADEARAYLEGLEANGGTAGHLGTAWGLYALAPEWASVFGRSAEVPADFDDEETEKIMVIMTDGDFTSTQDPSMDNNDAYGYFQAACALARRQGIDVYTVGFRASNNTDTQLTACAGTAVRYFNVDNRDALIRAFKKISDSATQVRLSS